ncbi:hypothetical protein D915_008588 [Fasciola hepatica]|uniref:BHLH domain-containing protein n=1 Tax=Fasciola hepatica TaxID=6192 RepID=A0A4E0QZN3_FASHE|nr:hypothetical protein D915_008588 [Fasciola hepatica]
MNPVETKKKRKVDAERNRRTEINQRVEQVRHLLGLEEQLTRIQVLKKAADVTYELVSNHSNPESVLPSTHWLLEPRHLVRMGMTKALIEKYRRQLERRELNRVRELLGAEQKSDISLLDDLIRLFQPLLNSDPKSSSKLVKTSSISSVRRRPLQSIDLNIQNVDRNPAMTKQPPEKFRKTLGDSTGHDSYWRPWET